MPTEDSAQADTCRDGVQSDSQQFGQHGFEIFEGGAWSVGLRRQLDCLCTPKSRSTPAATAARESQGFIRLAA